MTGRKFLLALTAFAFIGLPSTSKASVAYESEASFSKGNTLSNEFRPKKKKKKKGGGHCEAYGRFAAPANK